MIGAGQREERFADWGQITPAPASSRSRIVAPVLARQAWLILGLLCGSLAAAEVAAPVDPIVEASKSLPVSAEQKFYIAQIKVIGIKQIPQGETLLTPKEIQEAIYPFLGPYRTQEDVEGARQALLQAYRDKGYQTVGVQIPLQRLQHGVVYLKVVASTVGRIRVVGSRFYDLDQIRRELPHLQPGTVPNFTELPQDLTGLNGLPDRQVTPSLKPGTVPGTVDVNLNVKDHFPLHGSVEFNNEYILASTDYRAVVSASYDNLFQLGHSLSLSYTVAPQRPSDEQFFSAAYTARIPNIPWLSYLFYADKSDTDLNQVAAGTGVDTKGQGLGLRQILTLPTLSEDKGFSHSISIGIDYKYYYQDISQTDNNPGPTPATYYPVSFSYAANWQHSDGSLTTMNDGLVYNLRGIGSNDDTFNFIRYGIRRDFMYIHGDLDHTQHLPEDFQLYNQLQWQVADGPLLTSEQFSAGGLTTVRGYLESEAIGDNGVVGNYELRTPSLSRWLGSDVNEWRFYEFADSAVLGLNTAEDGANTTDYLASVGVGSRCQIFDKFNGSIDFGFPLLAGPETQRDSWKITFRVWATF